jgi:uncharacterized protein YdaU (DUF1376 family)
MALLGLMWWIDRWRQSSAYMDMTLAEQGAYRNLLDEAHLRGGVLPLADRVLAKASGDAVAWPKVRAAVLAHFTKRPDGYHNATLQAVLQQSVRRAAKQEAYRRRRAGNEVGNADGNADGNGTGNNPGNQPGSQDQDLREASENKSSKDLFHSR